METFCDLLLAVAIAAFLGGLVLLVLNFIGGFHFAGFALGLASLVLGPVLLLVWERLAWEPFAKRLSQLD
jgi:hypothetical protein